MSSSANEPPRRARVLDEDDDLFAFGASGQAAPRRRRVVRLTRAMRAGAARRTARARARDPRILIALCLALNLLSSTLVLVALRGTVGKRVSASESGVTPGAPDGPRSEESGGAAEDRAPERAVGAASRPAPQREDGRP